MPNGKYIKKGSFKLIATFDPTIKGSALNILPEAIKNNSILFFVPHYLEQDYINICNDIFENENYDDEKRNNEEEIKKFVLDINKISNYIFKNQLKELISLNDIYKYYLLKREIKDIFDDEFIIKILFIQRFDNLNEMENITKELGYKYDNLWPEFYYAQDEEEDEEYFCASPFKADEQIKIKIKGESDDKKIKYIYSLTPEQRICLIFLMICYNSSIPCIIQGPSFSGKTHLIKLFIDLINEDLEIIHLNNDSGINILIGQVEPNNKLDNDSILKITNLFKDIEKYEELKHIYNGKIELDSPKSWKPIQFKAIIKEIENLSKDIKLKYKEELKKIKFELKSKLSLLNNLDKNKKKSTFEIALIEGKNILLDGIEAAQPELFEKISSLFNKEPSLNLFEKGPEYIYSKNSENPEFRIHENFRLFITYNPKNVDPQKKLSSGFLNKSLIFSLSELDNSLENIALILSGMLIKENIFKDSNNDQLNTIDIEEEIENKDEENNNDKYIIKNIDEEKMRDIAARFASVHNVAKKFSLENLDDFAGKKPFLGTSLKFIYNSIKSKNNNLKDLIISIIEDCYCFSYKKNIDNFKVMLLNAFLKTPETKIIQYLRRDENEIDKRYSFLIKTLEHFKKDSNIDLKNLINQLGYVQFNHLPNIKTKVEN